MTVNEFLDGFIARRLNLKTDDSEEFRLICDMITERGIEAYDGHSVYEHGMQYRQDYPYIGMSSVESNTTCAWRSAPSGRESVTVSSIDFDKVDNQDIAEAVALLY